MREFMIVALSAVCAMACGDDGGGQAGNGGNGATGGNGGGGGAPGGPLTISEVAPLSENASDWNEYVSADDPSSPCPGTATTYQDCFHAGERRTATVTGVTSCGDLTIADALSAFVWGCAPDGEGLRVFSTGLTADSRLSDLLDFEQLAWRENAVTVTDGTRTASTATTAWWGNPIVADNDGGSLDTAGTIYVVTDTAAGAYTLDADRLALVVQPGNRLLGADAGGAAVSAADRQHLWVEGFIDAAGDDLGVSFTNVRFSRLHGVTADRADTGANADGIELVTSDGNVLHQVTASNSGRYGIHGVGSTGNRFADILIDANDNWGFFLETSGANDIVGIVTQNNDNWGIHIDQSPNTRLMHVTSANNVNWGVYIDDAPNSIVYDVRSYNNENYGIFIENCTDSVAADLLSANQRNYGIYVVGLHNVILNATSANNDNNGFNLDTTNAFVMNALSANNDNHGIDFVSFFDPRSGNAVLNAISAHNTASGFRIESESNAFSGNLKLGDNLGDDCDVDPAAVDPGLVDVTCENQGASDATRQSGIDLAATFAGKVTADDSANDDDTDGASPYEALTDWASFENETRTWGLDGGDFPSDDHDTDCDVGGSCRIWDWSLTSTDSVARDVNAVPTAADTYVHTWAASTENRCGTIVGAQWTAGTCTSRFLLHARELMDDGVGNDNALCESNEDCLYTPNIGRYQGHGPVMPTGASFTGGGLQNIRLFEHEANGR